MLTIGCRELAVMAFQRARALGSAWVWMARTAWRAAKEAR